ncbi:deazaflavin-dependent oxidoreductase (nitroreductase family) [Nocardia transvalensis]|uniref:Deazaflavin-dependent oxidoreductase (Nitroreductase family) n=1 Tax=Nocardia transvalensis TaxID=37333 RepID=A0A7W9PF97_9NOCA|nr:nitroreductase/quinone reductase family protein [Nocardia transvalensis]MBB5914990.1 deazaflavin-dependent oxidoreductase (nitroreductase family) [Nocardia transvalensis]
MANRRDIQHRVVTTFQRNLGNPILRRLSPQTLLETTGRVSGQPRVTPIGGRRTGTEFWFVSEFGERSQYVRNIQADNRVRLRLRGHWHTGTAHLVPDDDARARLKQLPWANSAVVGTVGTDLLSVRIDLD